MRNVLNTVWLFTLCVASMTLCPQVYAVDSLGGGFNISSAYIYSGNPAWNLDDGAYGVPLLTQYKINTLNINGSNYSYSGPSVNLTGTMVDVSIPPQTLAQDGHKLCWVGIVVNRSYYYEYGYKVVWHPTGAPPGVSSYAGGFPTEQAAKDYWNNTLAPAGAGDSHAVGLDTDLSSMPGISTFVCYGSPGVPTNVQPTDNNQSGLYSNPSKNAVLNLPTLKLLGISLDPSTNTKKPAAYCRRVTASIETDLYVDGVKVSGIAGNFWGVRKSGWGTVTNYIAAPPPTTFALTVSPGANGTATGSVTGKSSGDVVNISATPNGGYVFDKWTTTGPGSIGSTANASTTYTMGAGNATATASFKTAPTIPAPTGSITADSTTMTVGQSTTLRSHAKMGAGDTLTGHSIDLPEGTTYSWGGTTADYNVAFTPTSAGTYTFYNRINTSNHSWATYGSVTITVAAAPVNQKPSIAYFSGATTVYPGTPVAITFRATDPEGFVDAIWIDKDGVGNRYDPVSPATSPADMSNWPFTAGPVGTTYTIAARAKDNQGAVSAYETVTVSVVGRPTTFSAGGPFTYNGTPKTVTISANPAAATFTTGGDLTKTNAGDYVATAVANGDYVGSNNALAWKINKAPQPVVSITPVSSAINLGATVSFTASGGAGTGDYSWSGSASGTGVTKAYQFNALGTYSLTVYRIGDGNYTDSSSATATVTVSAIPLTFAAAPMSFVYDGAVHGPVVTAKETISGNPVAASGFVVAGETTKTNPGSYTITAKGQGGYDATPQTITWSITPAGDGTISARSVPAARYEIWFNQSPGASADVKINP